MNTDTSHRSVDRSLERKFPETLDELPEDVQPFVKRLFDGDVSARIELDAPSGESWLEHVPDDRIRQQIESWMKRRPTPPKIVRPDQAGDLQQQLDDVAQQLKELRGQLRSDNWLDEVRSELRQLREDLNELREKK